MDHVLVVQVSQSHCQLSDVVSRSRLIKSLFRLPFQLFVELTSRGILQDQVDFLFVPEEPVHPQHVLVSEVTLNFYFSSQLVLNITLLKLLFVKHLQSNNELRLFLSGKVNVAKLASSECFPKLKVFYSPFFGRLLLLLDWLRLMSLTVSKWLLSSHTELAL